MLTKAAKRKTRAEDSQSTDDSPRSSLFRLDTGKKNFPEELADEMFRRIENKFAP